MKILDLMSRVFSILSSLCTIGGLLQRKRRGRLCWLSAAVLSGAAAVVFSFLHLKKA